MTFRSFPIIRFNPRALVLLLIPALQAQFVKDWHAVTNGRLELISRYDPAAMSRIIADVDWVSRVFEANLDFEPPSGRSVLFFLPDSPFEFEQMSGLKSPEAYYTGPPWRDLIVMRTFPNARHIALHEYTHLVLRHTGKVAACYNEGTAEYFATMQAAARRCGRSRKAGRGPVARAHERDVIAGLVPGKRV
jgi:hypothetical protein